MNHTTRLNPIVSYIFLNVSAPTVSFTGGGSGTNVTVNLAQAGVLVKSDEHKEEISLASAGAWGFGTFAIGLIAVTAVTSWVIGALTPKPDFSSLRGLLANTRDATSPQEVVYGEVRKGGVVTFMESTGDKNKFLHQIICLAGHEVNDIGDIYINDLVANPDPTTHLVGGDWNDKIYIRKFLGTSTQNVYGELSGITDGPEWKDGTSGQAGDAGDFKGQGIACLYVRLEYDQDVFAEGIPIFTAKVQGKKVLDPRTSTTAYSNNPALCIRDYLTSNYGLSDTGDINDTMFNAAANACDESVTLANSGTQTRYEMNGAFVLSKTPSAILADMMTSCAGTLFWGQGEWQLKVGEYTTPVKTFTLDDFRSGINLTTKHSRRDNFNIVRGTFIDADQDWVRADYPEIRSTSFISDDNGLENAIDLTLPFTTNSFMAQRLAKMTLFRSREQMTISADFGMEAFEVQVGDIVEITNERYGWTQKDFEVVGWKFSNSSDSGEMLINMTLRETSSAAFSWSAEEVEITSNDSDLPDPRAGLTVQNLSVSQQSSVTTDGTFTLFARLSWDAVDSAFVDHYEVQWRKTADTDYQSTTTDANSLDTGFLIDGVEYTFRVRAVTGVGYRGAFAQTTLTTAPDTTAPSEPTMGSATGSFNQIKVSWTNPSDDDFKEAIVFRNTTNNSASATEIARISGDTYVDAGLPDNTTYHYWVKAADFSGNVSGFSSTADATTNESSIGADGDPGQNARGYVMTNQSHTVPSGANGVVDSYAGSGTDIEIYDGHSKLGYVTGSLSNGKFTILSTTVSPSSAISVGAASYITNGVRIGDHSNMNVSEDTVTITYEINGRNYAGSTFTFDITQTITKSSAGSDGAGRWNIPVTSLPTTSAQAQTAWDASSVGRDEVESDQAWFYTGTEANPTAQSVWIYDSGTSTWNEQNEVIDGNLLVTGTVTSDAVETNFIDAFEIDAAKITSGLLEADRIQIDGVTLDTVTTGTAPNEITKLIIAGSGVGTAQIATNAVTRTAATTVGSTFTTTSNTSVDIAALTFTEDAAYDLYAWASGDVENNSGSTKEIAFQLENTANSSFAKQIVNLADGDKAHLSLMGFTTTANGSNDIAFTMTCVGGADLIFSQPFHFFILGIKR